VDYATGYEMFLFWNHLTKAKMIPGSFNGAPGPAGINQHIAGTNSPFSKLEGAGWGAMYEGTISGSSVNFFDAVYGHILIIGAPSVNNLPVNGALTTKEALAIDMKIDDGNPASGYVMAFKNGCFFQACATTAVSATAAYDMTLSGRQCALVFITGF